MSGYEYTKISWFFVFSETNERVNFWNILFDVNQKQLDEKFLLTASDPVNCTIETTDAKFSNVFNTKKQVKFVFNIIL